MSFSGVTVYKAIKEANARAGEYIVVLGAGGGLGHLAVQYAAYQGLKVIAVDTGSDKEELCKKLGAVEWVDFKTAGDKISTFYPAFWCTIV